MKHQFPSWYHEAKIGVLFSWGVSSVAGFAPAPASGSTSGAATDPEFFHRNPEASWYLNGLRLPDSAVRAHQESELSRYFTYGRMARRITETMDDWDASVWVELAAEIGARYLVLTAKHPDGYLMWPSEGGAAREGFCAKRDLLGDIVHKGREYGLRIGFYYSGRLDWYIQDEAVDSIDAALRAGVDDSELAAAVTAHYQELIDRYRPDLLWNDTGIPTIATAKSVLAHFAAAIPGAVANDRWGTVRGLARARAVRSAGAAKRALAGVGAPSGIVPQYTTIEIDARTPPGDYPKPPFEAIVPLGSSWAYNRSESWCPTGEQLIAVVTEVAASGGNVLLAIGPDADGVVDRERLGVLLELGAWLRRNGEAIYGTYPWRRRSIVTPEGVDLRFTANESSLFVITRGHPRRLQMTVPGVDLKKIPGYEHAKRAGDPLSVALLGYGAISYAWNDEGIQIAIPGDAQPQSSFAFEIRFRRVREPEKEFNPFYDLI